MSRYQQSKSRRAYEATQRVTKEPEPSWKEKAAMLSMEQFMDITMNASTGSLSTWYFVAKNYDDDKSLFDKDNDFQYALGTAIGSQVLLSTTLYTMGMSGLEFAAYKFALTSAPKQAALSAGAPAIAAAGSLYLADAYIESIGEYEPSGNVHDKSSFWSSIGAAMAGTFGGMPDVGNY